MRHLSIKRRLRKKLVYRKKAVRPRLVAGVVSLLLLCLSGGVGHAAQCLWKGLVRGAESWPYTAMEHVLLRDKGVVAYLVLREEERNSFRLFADLVLERDFFLAAGRQEVENDTMWETESWSAGMVMSQDTAGEDEVFQVQGDLLEGVLTENTEWGGQFLPVSSLAGGVQKIESAAAEVGAGIGSTVPAVESSPGVRRVFQLLESSYSIEQLSDVDYLLGQYYIVDSITSAKPELFDVPTLLEKDLSLDGESEDYQILIYHTHASEGYADSQTGEVLDTVRGPGELLAEYLRGYGYSVYHDMTAYDVLDGKDNRNYAYSTARPQIEAFLAQHTGVQVVIDLHRDSGTKRVTQIDGKPTARIMLFNGLCRNSTGPIADLENPNLAGNLAFSLQTNLAGRVLYPDLMFRIYLKNYRYNQHFMERCMLVELGTEQNTLEEACNAMKPFAEILDMVLRK